MDYGTDLKLKTGFGGGVHKAGKDKPRQGAAKGQGMGMGGLDRARVSKAMMEVKGVHGGKPEFYCGGMKG